jgi:hypothetical protein
MKKTLLAVLLSLLFTGAYASYSAITTNDTVSVAAKYSGVGVGASASGMGDAYTGAAQDSLAIFWNPAGMVNMMKKDNEYNMFFAHDIWLMNSMIDNISVAKSFKNIGVFGLAVSYYNSGDMDKYGITDDGLPINLNSKFSNNSVTAILSYANALDKDINFGINVKYLLDTIDTDSTGALAFDLGLKYYFPLVKGISFNLVAKNFGGQFNNQVLLKQVILGLLYDFSIENWNIKAEYDAVGELNNNALNRVGVEVATPYFVILRAGYFTDNTKQTTGFRNISLGAGVNLNKLYNIDFALEPYGDLGNAYKMSFGADF